MIRRTNRITEVEIGADWERHGPGKVACTYLLQRTPRYSIILLSYHRNPCPSVAYENQRVRLQAIVQHATSLQDYKTTVSQDMPRSPQQALANILWAKKSPASYHKMIPIPSLPRSDLQNFPGSFHVGHVRALRPTPSPSVHKKVVVLWLLCVLRAFVRADHGIANHLMPNLHTIQGPCFVAESSASRDFQLQRKCATRASTLKTVDDSILLYYFRCHGIPASQYGLNPESNVDVNQDPEPRDYGHVIQKNVSSLDQNNAINERSPFCASKVAIPPILKLKYEPHDFQRSHKRPRLSGKAYHLKHAAVSTEADFKFLGLLRCLGKYLKSPGPAELTVTPESTSCGRSGCAGRGPYTPLSGRTVLFTAFYHGILYCPSPYKISPN